MIDRVELRRLCAEAAPGDWEQIWDEDGDPDYDFIRTKERTIAAYVRREDAKFIVAAQPKEVLMLLAELEAAEAEAEEQQQQLRKEWQTINDLEGCLKTWTDRACKEGIIGNAHRERAIKAETDLGVFMASNANLTTEVLELRAAIETAEDALVAKEAEIERLKAFKEKWLTIDTDLIEQMSSKLTAANARIAELDHWWLREVAALEEDTRERYGPTASSDTEGKQGAFARGRMYEAASIAKALHGAWQDRARSALSEALKPIEANKPSSVDFDGEGPDERF